MTTTATQAPRTIDYSVAWISAIGKEYTIACALLDEEYDPPADLSGDDGCYIFGRIGHHHVVMACLPLARIGTSQAARLVADMMHTFPSLKLGLMVGIAGGAPSSRNDIRLGDVVVSTPDARKRCGGVFQYAFGRTVQGSVFEPTSFSERPHQILLNAAVKLKTNYERKGNKIAQTVEQVIAKNSPRLDDYKKPNPVIDILYHSSVVHPDEKVHCQELCQVSEQTIVMRPERVLDRDQPRIHYGIVGSADNLVRDATLRDQIGQRDGVLCFEMESAGLLSSELRCLVVRGICDYSDSHKNDDWQKYAAATAAAYAKDLLGVVGKRQVRQDGEVLTKRLFGGQQTVLKLLSYDNMHDKHNYSIPGMSFSHEWIWSTSFYHWLATPSNPYWICGKPGSGKSTLMAYLVHNNRTLTRLEEGGAKYKLLHFFYDGRAGDGLANNISGMLRVFLYQLAVQFEQVHKRLDKLLAQDRLKLDTPDDLLEITCDALSMPDTRFCLFIDGLDEYEGDLFELMHTCRLLKERTGVRLCIGSRPEARVSEIFNLFAMILMQDHNKASMYGYAKDQILKASSTKLDITSIFSDSLQDDLVERAEGIMLWFKMSIDEIIDKYVVGTTEEKIQQSIQDIPQGLIAMYERILSRIPQQYHYEAAFLLFLVQQLHDLSNDIHDLSDDRALSTIVFSATDMDHVWGVYDFVSEKLGSEIGLPRLSNQSVLQARIKMLLAGLVEIYEVDLDKTLTRGTTNLDVRHVHKTFSAFIRKSNWVEERLHPRIQQEFPDPFWPTLLTDIIIQATEEQVITPAQIKECKKDTLAFLGLFNTGEGETAISRSTMTRRFAEVLVGQRSTLLSVINAFGLYGPGGRWSKVEMFLEDATHWFLNSFSSDFEFPTKWKSRHVILRTAFLNVLDISYKYEKSERSAFISIHPAMRSYLNAIFGFHYLIDEWVTQQTLLVPLIQDSDLDGIWDLIVAVARGLSGYFSDRVFQATPSSAKARHFVVKAVIAQSFNPLHKDAIFPFVHTLAANGCFLDCRNICYFLTECPTLSLAEYNALTFTYLLPPDISTLERGWCNCRHESKEVGLLFHWAQLSDMRETSPVRPKRSRRSHEVLLAYLLKLGIDINVACYSGGNVLHAILDHAVQPLQGRQQLSRKDKFLTLVKHGINPRLVGKNGNALQCANSLKKRQSRWKFLPGLAPDQHDLDFIIGYLHFYESNGSWPADFESDDEDRDLKDDESSLYSEDESTANEDDITSIVDTTIVTPEMTRIEPEISIEDETLLGVGEDSACGHNLATMELYAYDGDESSEDEFYPAEDSPRPMEIISEQRKDISELLEDTGRSIGNHHVQGDMALRLAAKNKDAVITAEPNKQSQKLVVACIDLEGHEILPDTQHRLGIVSANPIEGCNSATDESRPRVQAQHDTDTSIPADNPSLEQLWEAQASFYSANLRLVPQRVRRRINPDQAMVWMFVFQTLQNLGLRMTDEVDYNIVYVLEALGFKHVRKAIINMLEISDRKDLLAPFYEMERIQLGPLLNLRDTKLQQTQTVEPKSVEIGQSRDGQALCSGQHDTEVSTSSLVHQVETNLNLGVLEHKRNISESTAASHSRGSSESSSAQVISSMSAERSPSAFIGEWQDYCEPGMLRHRMFVDPDHRKNLRVDPGAERVPEMTRQQYDRLLLEDFRWTIIEHLGYRHEVNPSRKESHQLLVDADWDFDRAIAQCIDRITKDGS